MPKKVQNEKQTSRQLETLHFQLPQNMASFERIFFCSFFHLFRVATTVNQQYHHNLQNNNNDLVLYLLNFVLVVLVFVLVKKILVPLKALLLLTIPPHPGRSVIIFLVSSGRESDFVIFHATIHTFFHYVRKKYG